MGEGSGRCPLRPRARLGRPSLGPAGGTGWTLDTEDRLWATRAQASDWRPCPLPPPPVLRPRAGGATCVPAVPPRPSRTPWPCPLPARRRAWPAVPDRKEQTLGSFGGREGRALKGPRPLFTAGEGSPRRPRGWNGMGRTLSCRVPSASAFLLTLSPALCPSKEENFSLSCLWFT